MPIRVLSVHLVNKIAAGEVIERPASVVKELVENSLDAGSTRIDVAIEEGGRKLIAVTDDGGGMCEEDLALAFVPHATSKISGEDDLFQINTMGFRGEALASIASISHAHIRTRRREDNSGLEIESSGGVTGQVRPCAAAVGTTVSIRDLFFNTPARRKFMRAVNTEMGQISEQVTRLALPHPQVAFHLTHNGRDVLKLPQVRTTLQRAADLFGQELADTLLPIVSRDGGMVAGLVSKPSAGRSSAQMQYVFLNGRYIRDRSLSHALKESYRGVIDPNRHPVTFVFLSIDPGEVDVNVHPTKVEVRFRDGQAIYGAVLGAIRDTLNRANLSPGVSFAPSAGGGQQTAAAKALQPTDASQNENATPPIDLAAARGAMAEGSSMDMDDARRQSLRQAMADFFRSMPKPQPRLAFPESTPFRKAEPCPAGAPEPDAGPVMAGEAEPEMTPVAATAGPISQPASSGAMQIHNSYIVAPCPEGLLIIDQHALHERVLYNDLKRRLAQGVLTGQRLLIPTVVGVSPAGLHVLAARADLLARLGIEAVAFGPSSVAVGQFPTLLADRGVSCEEFIREIVDKLLENESAYAENLLEELLSMLACKAAVKAGDVLSPEEMDSLIRSRNEADKASSCPHGRPTTLTLSLRDLEKQFKRT